MCGRTLFAWSFRVLAYLLSHENGVRFFWYLSAENKTEKVTSMGRQKQNEWQEDPDFLAGKACYDQGDLKNALLHFGASMDSNNPYGALGVFFVGKDIFKRRMQGEIYELGSNPETEQMLQALISSSFFVYLASEELAADAQLEDHLQEIAESCFPESQFWQMCTDFKLQMIENADLDEFDF